MHFPLRFLIFVAAHVVLLLGGCVLPRTPRLTEQRGESLVLIGEQPSQLAFFPARQGSVRLRSTYHVREDTVEYEEGRDYAIDYEQGAIRRLRGSRIPDFGTNILFGREDFDHTKYPGYGNKSHFVYADYRLQLPVRWPRQIAHGERLKATQAKLRAGEAVTIVAFGDSITNGGEATSSALVFWQRWVGDLERKYPRARISAINGATGGDTTTRGLERLRTKVLDAKPDLVLIGFGMNDHNRRGVPPPEFARQLTEMVTRIRSVAAAEVVLLSAFPPNPKWTHGTGRMHEYAQATARVAEETRCVYASVFENWQQMTGRKRPEDLLANNINHPNDFGHWIYYRVLAGLDL